MKPSKQTLVLPLLMITVGTGWLLSVLGIAPNINWIWILGLAVTGVLTFVLVGFDKVTFVTGSFLLVASCLSLLRQTDRLDFNVEVPVLVIVAGVLMLLARHPAVPNPKWVQNMPLGDDAKQEQG